MPLSISQRLQPGEKQTGNISFGPPDPERQAAMEEALLRMREAAPHLGLTERAFRFLPDVVRYLNDELQWRNGLGHPITRITVQNWIRTRGFPRNTIHRRSGIACTNFQILAWGWTYHIYQRNRAKRGVIIKPKPGKPSGRPHVTLEQATAAVEAWYEAQGTEAYYVPREARDALAERIATIKPAC